MSAGTQSNINITSSLGFSTPSKEVGEFKYEKSEIPKELIDMCETLSIEKGETYFIFDKSISNIVKSRYINNKEEKREILLDNIISDSDKYHIGSEIHFREMPSRFSYYDTEIKLTDRLLKYKFVTDFLNTIGFIPNREFNFGPDMDQSYNLVIYNKTYITRLKPNLFLSIQSGFNDTSHPNIIFDGFFSKSKIIDSLNRDSPNFKEIIRDIKLNIIL